MTHPRAVELDALLGRSRAAWKALTGFVRSRHRIQDVWTAEPDGWTLRLRKGGKS